MNKELKLPLWVLLAIVVAFIGVGWWGDHRAVKANERAQSYKAKYESCQTQQYAKEQLNKADSLIKTIEDTPLQGNHKEYLKNKYKNKK